MQAPVTQLYENTWAIEDRGVRIFVLEGTERAMVVDTGMTGLDIRTLAGGLTPLPLFLVNTHADMDHVAGNGAFDSFYMHPAEAAVYHHGPIGIGKIIPVYEGTVFDLGNRLVKVLRRMAAFTCSAHTGTWKPMCWGWSMYGSSRRSMIPFIPHMLKCRSTRTSFQS